MDQEKVKNRLAIYKETKTISIHIFTHQGFERLWNELRDKFSSILTTLNAGGDAQKIDFKLIIECDVILNDAEKETVRKTLDFLSNYHSFDLVEVDNCSDSSKSTNNPTCFNASARLAPERFQEIRIATVGNVDAGKSTLLGVLAHNQLDDGRGLMRTKLFRYPHEKQNGRTSSVGSIILGFDEKGQVLNRSTSHSANIDWADICQKASRVVNFIDLAGHEKYLKTTIFGMLALHPDYVMIIVGANSGIIGMTKEHLGLTIEIKKPMFFVITKVDVTKQDTLGETRKILTKICKSNAIKRVPVTIRNESDLIYALYDFQMMKICPIFEVSSVEGSGLDHLKCFLSKLESIKTFDSSKPLIFCIDDVFRVSGVGCVVSGTIIQGTLNPTDTLLLGPDIHGNFTSVSLKSIYRKRSPVEKGYAGDALSISIKKISKSVVRKGMALVAESLKPKASWEFDADIKILHQPSTIEAGYQASVHIECVRQTATITNIEKGFLRTGDSSAIRMQFMCRPEFIRVGTKFLFREGRTKAIGTITQLHFEKPAEFFKKSRVKSQKLCTNQIE